MITREDIEQAIIECQAEREPNSNTCIKLAAFLTIREQLFSDSPPRTTAPEPSGYSYAAPPDVPHESIPETVFIDSNTEFAEAINGMDSVKAWALIDELMKILKNISPRLYDAVMRRIEK